MMLWVDSCTVPPMPCSLTTWGLVGSLSVTVSVPTLKPVVAGAKATLIVQRDPAGRVERQLWVCLNSLLATMLEILSGVVRVLERVTSNAGPWVPTTAWPRSRVDEMSGQLRGGKTSGASGAWLKLKLSVMSFASASRSVNGGRAKRSSMNFKTDENSYCLWEM